MNLQRLPAGWTRSDDLWVVEQLAEAQRLADALDTAAQREPDPARRDELAADADELRAQVAALRREASDRRRTRQET